MAKGVWQMVSEAVSRIDNLSVDQVAAEIEANTATIVDIRDFRERILKGAIPGAIHAPRGMLEFWVDEESEYHRAEFQPDRRYILYCAAGARSALATDTLQQMGYRDVAHLEGGFGAWEAAGNAIDDIASTAKWARRPSEPPPSPT